MYRIFTECFGYRMYASEVGNGWTDVPAEATVFDHRDNRQHKLKKTGGNLNQESRRPPTPTLNGSSKWAAEK